MTTQAQDLITFEVETERVLQILSREIYDSPLALLRENLQNAYDAILMRCVVENRPVEESLIDVQVSHNKLVILDDGIGMTEQVLRNNFWKAGSSGKRGNWGTGSGRLAAGTELAASPVFFLPFRGVLVAVSIAPPAIQRSSVAISSSGIFVPPGGMDGSSVCDTSANR